MLKTCWEFMCASVFSSLFANFTAVEFLFITWMSSGDPIIWVRVCACSLVQSLAAWSTYRLLFAASLVLTFMSLCCCYSFSCRYAIKISKFTWSSSVLSSAVTTRRQCTEFQQWLCIEAWSAHKRNFYFYVQLNSHQAHSWEAGIGAWRRRWWNRIHNQLCTNAYNIFYRFEMRIKSELYAFTIKSNGNEGKNRKIYRVVKAIKNNYQCSYILLVNTVFICNECVTVFR